MKKYSIYYLLSHMKLALYASGLVIFLAAWIMYSGQIRQINIGENRYWISAVLIGCAFLILIVGYLHARAQSPGATHSDCLMRK